MRNKNSEPDIVVLGGANTDYTVRTSKLPAPGATAQGDLFLIEQGGKGANQAVAAARLGARVAFIARIGQDSRGDAMLARLHKEGVDTRYVVYDPDAPTGAAVIQVDAAGEKQIAAAPNANGNLSVADVERAHIIEQARVLLCQLETPLEGVLAAARRAHAAGAQIVLDPAPPAELPGELLQLLTVIKPNRNEAEALTGIQSKDRAAARKAAEQLRSRGVKAVAIQAGDAGDLLVWADGECWLPRIAVDSVDATGAGDAFAAALAVALAEDKSWPEAGRLASAAAALTTTKLGAQPALPRRAEVTALLDKVLAQLQGVGPTTGLAIHR
jgi:ribokinase